MLGELVLAAADAEQSVTYAERSGDAFQRIVKRTVPGNALHHAGQRGEAEALFREAEEMQADWKPEYPLLFSLAIFHYCDLASAPPGDACSIYPTSLNLGPCWKLTAPSPGALRGRSNGLKRQTWIS